VVPQAAAADVMPYLTGRLVRNVISSKRYAKRAAAQPAGELYYSLDVATRCLDDVWDDASPPVHHTSIFRDQIKSASQNVIRILIDADAPVQIGTKGTDVEIGMQDAFRVYFQVSCRGPYITVGTINWGASGKSSYNATTDEADGDVKITADAGATPSNEPAVDDTPTVTQTPWAFTVIAPF
jgi:hypothetical protein